MFLSAVSQGQELSTQIPGMSELLSRLAADSYNSKLSKTEQLIFHFLNI